VNAGPPLVTLGVPVRNGAAMLAAALDSIVAQDYPNLEVVVSDNASTDATPEILRDYVRRYPHIRVIRQEQPLTAIDNFMFVMREAKGEFFAWCAHDDTRSADFVSGLMPAFEDPNTMLAFGDLYIWDGVKPAQLRSPYDFANDGLPAWRRIRKTAGMQCYHIYGLWRTARLRSIRYTYTHWWSDMPILLASAATGNFRHRPGPRFCYFEIVKAAAVRAAYQDNLRQTSRVKNFAALFKSAFSTVSDTAGLAYGVAAIAFLFEKYSCEAGRRVSSALTRASR
jgi:glycosyltransferase involved in cell wall biosynthesis